MRANGECKGLHLLFLGNEVESVTGQHKEQCPKGERAERLA